MESLLQEILDELRSSKSEVKLGFGEPPKTRYIYANRQYPDCLWYFWDGGKSVHEPIGTSAITGFVEKVEIEDKEFRGKKDPKFNVYIRVSDRSYVIQSGAETLFAKGLMFTLSKLPVEAFAKPIMIAVDAGETDQVLFARVYNPTTGALVFAPYGDDVNWGDVFVKLQNKLGAKHE
jgi:3',5'-cyclic AMP phosphodiesterase CpdA